MAKEIKVTRVNRSKEVVEVSGATDAEMIALPRISTWNGFRPKVKLGDSEVILGYHFYTDAEKAAYKKYDKEHRGGQGGTRSSAPKIDVEKLDALEKIISGLKDEKVKNEGLALIKALRPVDPKRAKIAAMLGKKVEELTDAEIKAIEVLGL